MVIEWIVRLKRENIVIIDQHLLNGWAILKKKRENLFLTDF